MISNHNVYIITKKINELTSENLPVRLKQGNKASKNDIADFVKQTDLVINQKALTKKLLQIKQNKSQLKKNYLFYQMKLNYYQQKVVIFS